MTNSNESTGDGDGELEQTERQDIKSATEEEDISLDIWISEDIGTQGVRAYRRQVWMLAYGFLLTVLLWIIFRAAWSYKRSNFLEQLIKERLQLVDQKIKHQLSRDAGSHLTQLIYLFLFELSDHHLRPLSQNLESLLKSIPPSIKVRYESQIKEVMFELEQISFAPAETAARLRTQSHLRSVRDKVSSLLKDMGKYYSRRSLEK